MNFNRNLRKIIIYIFFIKNKTESQLNFVANLNLFLLYYK